MKDNFLERKNKLHDIDITEFVESRERMQIEQDLIDTTAKSSCCFEIIKLCALCP
jgi:hypothetical protein